MKSRFISLVKFAGSHLQPKTSSPGVRREGLHLLTTTIQAGLGKSCDLH
jgi:hypothetical protein